MNDSVVDEQKIPLKQAKDSPSNNDYDCLIVIALGISSSFLDGPYTAEYAEQLLELSRSDAALDSEGGFLLLPTGHKIRRLIYSPVGPVNRDQDDVRRFRDAAYKGMVRAMKAGAVAPIIVIPSPGPFAQQYRFYDVATVLGAYEAIYTPLELREAFPDNNKIRYLSFCNFSNDVREADVFKLSEAIERGRNVARDIGGSDPERMSSLNIVSYVRSLFSSTSIGVEVVEDEEMIKREFPCLAIVDRGSLPRHRSRIIFLEYEPPEDEERPVDTTLILIGKGVTYDTGGHDIKAGGIMAGMHRDKCGAAAVAGFFQTLEILKPKGLRVFGAMPLVRNSIGLDCYVADELVTARSGVRVRVGNTDAEGRMQMVDTLCHYKEKLLRESHPNPQIFTIATLTGHACLAAGEYSIIMDNGPAREKGMSRKISEAGERIGDLFEVSTIRREDYEFNKGKSEYEHILQCNNLPSSRTPRGHQIPAAFLLQVSGLDKHGLDSEKPIPFSHMDIAASSGPFPGIPSGAPIPALVINYLLSR